MKINVRPAEGKLGVMFGGCGGVFTTLMIGVEAIKLGLAPAIGSQALIGKIRLGKRNEWRFPEIKDFVPLVDINDIVFAAWDPIPDNGLEAARKARVVENSIIDQVSEQLASIKPMPAVFENRWAKRILGDNVKSGRNKMELAEQIMDDIDRFKSENGCDRLVMIWAASTEIYMEDSEVHQSLDAFEKAMYDNDERIAPSMLYAYAALKKGVPFANGTPSLTSDIPALVELACKNRAPICGKDFKTGQTLLKTGVAPIFKARLLKLDGWYSTNILGNRDGEVLDEEENFKSKEVSKGSVLDTILSPEIYPDLYGDYYHKIRINYYPPRGDDKEGWDNIDIRGWLGAPMQIKINFLCRDSILAAPVVYDIISFLDLAQRSDMVGVQEWMSLFFKVPQTAPGLYPENDLFIQLMKFKNRLRHLKGEELITHLGLEYYD